MYVGNRGNCERNIARIYLFRGDASFRLKIVLEINVTATHATSLNR